jgi:hypothetical protein
MNAILANYRMGRMFLHARCAFCDHHWNWHWQGIRREIAGR